MENSYANLKKTKKSPKKVFTKCLTCNIIKITINKRKDNKMNEMICINCGIKEVNGSLVYCDECQHEIENNNKEGQQNEND